MNNLKKTIKNLPIAKKLIFGFAIIFFIFTLVTIYFLQMLSQINAYAVREAEIADMVHISNDLSIRTLKNIALLNEYKDIYDYSLVNSMQKNRAQIIIDMQKLRNKSKIPEVVSQLDSFALLLDSKEKLREEIIVAVNQKINYKKIEIMRLRREILDDQSITYITRIMEIEKNEFDKTMQRHAEVREDLANILIIVIGLVLGMIAIAFYWIARSVTIAVESISSMVQQIKNGNFAARVAVTNEDEFGVLAKFLNIMAEKLQQTHELMQKITKDLQLKLFSEKSGELFDKQAFEIEHLVYYDNITGLPNRILFVKLFLTSIAELKKNQKKAALFLIGIKNFRNINETLGRKLADVLLKEVAKRLISVKSSSDILAHFSGDEFVMLSENIQNPMTTEKLASHFLDVFEQPFLLNGYSITTSANIGIVLYPEEGHDVGTLIKHGEVALSKAKQLEIDKVIFSDKLEVEKNIYLQIETILRQAILKKQFYLSYQPIINSHDRSLYGVEALVRWEQGLFPLHLTNAEIIPAAEENGLIIPLGDAIVETALLQYKELEKKHFHKIKMSINLSTKQVIRKNFIGWIENLFTSLQIDPSKIIFEITETAIVKDIAVTINNLVILRKMGCGIHIDDFGTGYASLNLIRNLPITGIKIDKSFVQTASHDPKNTALVKMIFALADTMGYEVISEGVETEAQFNFMSVFSTNQKMQGYFLSKAISMAEIVRRYLV